MQEYLESSINYEKKYADMPVFDSNKGVGLEWEYEGKKRTFVIGDKKREVFFKIYSWVGMSGGAIHYYGYLHTYDLSFTTEGEKYFSCSSDCPDLVKGIKIHLRRKITKEEIEKYPDRFECYNEGDYITAFLSKEELIVTGKKIFIEKFTGNWRLIME